MEQRDFFISYTSADEPWARWIADVLKSNGYTVYVQALDIKPGDNFLEKMNEFLKHSRNFIAVWSGRYPKSRFCMAELQSAFYAWNKETMDCLLPVRIDNHPLEPLYAGLVYVNLSDMGAASETKLMDAVRDRVPRPVVPPVTLSAPRPVVPQKEPPPENAETLYRRGCNYYYGRNGIAQDYTKARDCWEQAAEKSHVASLNNLGWLYANGLGVKEDYTKARKYYEQAAAKGFAWSLNNLGSLYRQGLGVAVNYAKARDYYQQAVLKGNVEALYNLGNLYENGLGVTQSYSKALEYYEQAATKGNMEALCSLGNLYEHGLGVAKSYANARKYYEQAAAGENPVALYRLGYIFQHALGITWNYAKAWECYTKAAAKGNVNALYHLGELYEYGEGVIIDYAKALEYYQKAAKAGHNRASARVKEVLIKMRSKSDE